MAAPDPRDSAAVAEVIRRRAADQWGDVRLAEAPTSIGDGFDSHIHAVRLDGSGLPAAWRAPLVVRLLPSADRESQAHHEAEAQRWARDVGYPAPQVLDILVPDEGLGLPAQVMERAPGTTMLDALKARPWRAMQLVDQLAALQLALHTLPTDAWPGERDPQVLVDKRLALPRRVAEELDDVGIARALERAEPLRDLAAGGTHVVCHGDFHPLNVVVDGAQACVIDWTDAALGPREADVARTVLLFNVVSVAATSRVERAVLGLAGPRLAARYQRTYEATAPLDGARMRAWRGLHALHGWAQVVMLHAGGFDGASSSDKGRVPLDVARYLEARFDEALG